jgi:hypothetical protein
MMNRKFVIIIRTEEIKIDAGKVKYNKWFAAAIVFDFWLFAIDNSDVKQRQQQKEKYYNSNTVKSHPVTLFEGSLLVYLLFCRHILLCVTLRALAARR